MWLEAILPLLYSEEDSSDEVAWRAIQRMRYESFSLYDEATTSYRQAENLASEHSYLLLHMQRMFRRRACAVPGPTADGLLNRPIARNAIEANTCRVRMCKPTGATPRETDRM